jgi:hypothetical protein
MIDFDNLGKVKKEEITGNEHAAKLLMLPKVSNLSALNPLTFSKL